MTEGPGEASGKHAPPASRIGEFIRTRSPPAQNSPWGGPLAGRATTRRRTRDPGTRKRWGWFNRLAWERNRGKGRSDEPPHGRRIPPNRDPHQAEKGCPVFPRRGLQSSRGHGGMPSHFSGLLILDRSGEEGRMGRFGGLVDHISTYDERSCEPGNFPHIYMRCSNSLTRSEFIWLYRYCSGQVW